MKAKKTILILSDWFLPGYLAGGPIQSIVTLTSHLKEELHFKIITTDRDFKATKPYDGVKVNEWVNCQGREVFYISSDNMTPEFVLHLIKNTAHDTIYLNSLFSKLFTIYPLRWKIKGELKSDIVLAPRGMLRNGALAVKPIKKQLFLVYAKLVGLFKHVRWQSTSAEETLEIKKQIGSEANVTELSNFPTAIVASKPIDKTKGKLKLCFIARIVDIKNLNFAINVLKQTTHHDILFDVYGPKEDEAYWQQCEANAKFFPKHITFNYLGALTPEKIGVIISNYHALFLPTKTENFGHSIVETLQLGRPVIISNQTPWRNLKHENAGFDLDLNDMAAFSEAINFMAELNQEEFNRMCNDSSSFIHRQLNIEELTSNYLTLFKA